LGTLYESTVLVGDSTIDQRGSMAANIPFIFFRNGYDKIVDQTMALKAIDQIPKLLDIKF
jgi:phosphoglycolate phosphatase-like HAD superfamily hydrolase